MQENAKEVTNRSDVEVYSNPLIRNLSGLSS